MAKKKIVFRALNQNQRLSWMEGLLMLSFMVSPSTLALLQPSSSLSTHDHSVSVLVSSSVSAGPAHRYTVLL